MKVCDRCKAVVDELHIVNRMLVSMTKIIDGLL